MAGVTALRDAARAAVLRAEGRGFVRFLSQGEALLISDAPRRCQSAQELARLTDALCAAGFSCRIEDGLAYLLPQRETLLALCDAQPEVVSIDWDGPLFEAQALCARLLRERQAQVGEDGMGLLVDAARLLWQPGDKALAGLAALRAKMAAMLRKGERGGLYETGRLLCGWLAEREKK